MSVIGLRVGPFEVESEVPVPEPGRWYRAVRTGLTRKQPAEALVRVLDPEATTDERQQLQRAFDNLRALDDARVPQPIAYYEGIGALAVACVEGTPLDRLVEARKTDALPMAPGTLLDIALELAETLQHAHHKGRWHGHLWPGVVQLTSDGKLWIWGFGAGHEQDPPEPWLAPERARGLSGTPAIDQWGLGALIVGLISGKPPWSGADPRAEARKGELDATLAAVEAQWPALARLLRKMMDPKPESRFPSLQPVRQELLALSRKAGGTSERHRLATALQDRKLATPAPAPTRATPAPAPARATPAPAPARLPTPHAKDEIALTPLPAPARGTPIPSLRKLPTEAMSVVKPHLDDDLPVARMTPAPAPQRYTPPVEPTEERLATEIIEDRAATEVLEPQDLAEREPTEMSDVAALTQAVVAPIDEPVDDPLSVPRDTLVTLPEVPSPQEAPVSTKPNPPVPPPEEDEEVGDAATERWSAEQLMTVLKDLDQPETATRTPPPAPPKATPPASAPRAVPLPVAVTQPTQPPQPPPLAPVPVSIQQDPPSVANPTMVPLTDPGPPDEPTPAPQPRPALPNTGLPTSPGTDFGTDAGFFKGGPSKEPSLPPRADPPTGPLGLPTEAPPPPLPEPKPAAITKVAPLLAVLLILALVVFTLWNLLG